MKDKGEYQLPKTDELKMLEDMDSDAPAKTIRLIDRIVKDEEAANEIKYALGLVPDPYVPPEEEK